MRKNQKIFIERPSSRSKSRPTISYDNARRMKELEHLYQAAEKLASVAEVQEVLQQIVKSAREVLQADSALIWSYDAVRKIFLPAELAADGITPEVLEKTREDEPCSGGTATIVIEMGYLAVTDVGKSTYAYLNPPACGLRDAVGVKSFQGIALQVEGEPLGVLYVNYHQTREFDEEDKSALETFAYHAALALRKARLLAQLKKVRSAARIAATVSVLENLKGTLDAIAKGTQDALNCDAVTLYTYDQARDKIGFPPAMGGVLMKDEVLKFGFVDRNSVVHRILSQDRSYIAEDASSDLIVGGPFTQREAIKSSVSIPLRVGNSRVGVMFVNYRTRHHFTADELADIELFAHQAAVAIRNAQLYDETTKRTAYLQALYEAGKVVTSTLALDEILNRIAEQAWKLTGSHGQRAHFSNIVLVEGNKLSLKAAYPTEYLPKLQPLLIDINLEQEEHIGITGRTVKTGQSQLIVDVTQDPDYTEGDPETHSELAVPVKIGNEVIGVINVEHPHYNAFDNEDRHALEALAAQAAIAIENARYFEYLKRIKGYIGSKTAVDWIRMVSTAWGHSIRREVGTALGHLALLSRLLATEDLDQEIGNELEQLEKAIAGIKEIPITAPLSYEDAADSVRINELVKTHFERQWTHARYKPVSLLFVLQDDVDNRVTVRASREWLRRALEILVDNSVQAMLEADSPEKKLTVTTQLEGKYLAISIKDTGPGIPKNVMEKLFKEPIDKPVGSRGAGIGLILAQTIIQTYGGDIRVEQPADGGTNEIITLPVES